MKMRMLLLVSAVTLLLSVIDAGPSHRRRHSNLERIYDLATKYNESLSGDYFVEDVQQLVNDGCEDAFFCKVHQILSMHDKQNNEQEELVRNLKVFINSTQVDCAEILKNVTTSPVTKPLPDFLQCITTCVQRRNFSGGKKQNP